jgi:hypothetical protein
VEDKARRNYCEWFEANPALRQAGSGDERARSAAEKARGELDKLFGG